ncbi:MAG TPA: DUF3011 domain-containing protein [Rhodanobacteraceae bacterium]|nr:DUF3011 domain-containing protein [Rhodanobacteraceae bacterium]
MRVITGLVVTFVLSAAASAGAQTVYSNGPGHYDRNDRGPTVVCESQDGRYNRCDMPWRGGAQLVEQLSSTACVRGQTWGIRHGSLWVNNGCRGRFAPMAEVVAGGGWRPGPDWNRRFEVSCSSSGYNYQLCQVDVGRSGRVMLRRQTSNAACIEGRTWGFNRAGVWVDQGCAGTFLIDRRW